MVAITLVPYDPAWPAQFREVGAALRESLTPVLDPALTRIDHIGSTAVPALAAKPVIDVQVSVQDFAPEHADTTTLPAAVESLGISWHKDWPFRPAQVDVLPPVAVRPRTAGCLRRQPAPAAGGVRQSAAGAALPRLPAGERRRPAAL